MPWQVGWQPRTLPARQCESSPETRGSLTARARSGAVTSLVLAAKGVSGRCQRETEDA